MNLKINIILSGKRSPHSPLYLIKPYLLIKLINLGESLQFPLLNLNSANQINEINLSCDQLKTYTPTTSDRVQI